jgi:two-component system, response regulator PdtaR
MTTPGLFILVAEDEPLASMALRAQLEALGHDVLGPARDGDEALALGLCFPIDAALFDFSMPRRTGLEAAHALFQAAPTPVILLSGFGAEHLPDRIPRPPIFASLTKPADLADLRSAVRTAAEGFTQWIAAETHREQRVANMRNQRATIARALESLGHPRPTARAAIELIDEAARQNRSLFDLARQRLAGLA